MPFHMAPLQCILMHFRRSLSILKLGVILATFGPSLKISLLISKTTVEWNYTPHLALK